MKDRGQAPFFHGIGEVAARMRAAGSRVGVGEVVVAHRAAAVVPGGDARAAIRAALCSSRADLARFDAAWTPEAAVDPMLELLAPALPRVSLPLATAGTEREVVPVPAAWSSEELLREKDFAAYTEAERRAARALLGRLARRGAMRVSRRTRPGRGPVFDLRATVRTSMRTGGEPFHRRFRTHAQRQRPLVLVLDVSGSMAPYSRILLQYVQAAVAARRRVEAFVFGTRLTRVTRELAGRDPDRALTRATAAALDMGGGTRIGAAIAALNRVHGRRLGRGADVVILSDGWDRGDPALLSEEMARLRRCAHRVVWLNPLAADPRFEPLTQGMRAALPHTDRLLPGNSIGSLEALADLLEEA